jgi:beta-1,4-mannosyltransferase
LKRERAISARPTAPPGSTRRLRVLAFPKTSRNPFIGLFSTSIERQGADVEAFTFTRALVRRYDVLHLHWPESHLLSRGSGRSVAKHFRLFLVCLLTRLRGTRISWMIHNLQSHEADSALSRWLFALWFPKICSDVVALSEGGLREAREKYPALRVKRALVVPHGHYRDLYPRAPSRDESRRQLGLPQDAFVFLFLGEVRPYKNVPHLIRQFRELTSSRVRLLVAGMPGGGLGREQLESLASGDPRVILHLKFVDERDIPFYFGAADLVVLPFAKVLNSGSTLLALSLDRPVLASNTGSLPETQQDVGERWLQLFDGELTASHLRAASEGMTKHPRDGAPDLDRYDWHRIGQRLIEFYQPQ